MNARTLEQIKNAEIEVQPYEPNSRALPTAEDVTQRRESLVKSGLINPIIITEDENNVPLIVDGNLRYNLIRELKAKKKWRTFPLPVLPIPFDEAKSHRDIQTNHKSYDKTQLAIFGAYNYWDEVEKRSQQRQKQGKKATGTKGRTAEIVGRMSGANEKYVECAHELLEIDSEFFYDTFFIKRYPFKMSEAEELRAKKNDKRLIEEIIDEMKKIVANNNQAPINSNAKKSIYSLAKTIVDKNHENAHKKLIRKISCSDTEAKEIERTFLSKVKANTKGKKNDDKIPSADSNTTNSICEEIKENPVSNIDDEKDSNIIDFHEINKDSIESYDTESDKVKSTAANKISCLITISQPLTESMKTYIKNYIETNSNYTVEIYQEKHKERIQ